MGIEFDIDFEKFEGNGEWVQFLARFGAAWQAEAQRLAQVEIKNPDSNYGKMFRFELRPGNPPTLRVGNIWEKAIYVELDTEPHEITTNPPGRKNFGGAGAKNPPGTVPGSLAFFSNARVGIGPKNLTFAKKVDHPGTKGKHIIEEAVRAAGADL